MPILNESELDWLCDNVPDAPRSPKGGRPPADKRLMLQAIFWVLDNGAKWKDLPGKLGSKSTAHRWFRTWAQAGVFEELMNVAGLCIEEKEGFKLYECFIDGSFAKAKGGGDLDRCDQGRQRRQAHDHGGCQRSASSGLHFCGRTARKPFGAGVIRFHDYNAKARAAHWRQSLR